jgi:hypothetical protein
MFIYFPITIELKQYNPIMAEEYFIRRNGFITGRETEKTKKNSSGIIVLETDSDSGCFSCRLTL